MTKEATRDYDALTGPDRYAIKLPIFEGPLDLLLFLVRKHEVDIYDIPIFSVTKQYLDILKDMQKLNLEVAGEFFIMAATLMQIKSSLLLPKDEQVVNTNEEEEGGDPRWQLIQQLLEYQKFKGAAHLLQVQITDACDYIPRHYKLSQDQEFRQPLQKSDKIEMWNVFNIVLRKLAEKIIGAGEIHDENVSVSGRMEVILSRIQNENTFTFTSLFEPGFTLTHIVATFLAMLELTRLKKITIAQDVNFTDILIYAVENNELIAVIEGVQTQDQQDFPL